MYKYNFGLISVVLFAILSTNSYSNDQAPIPTFISGIKVNLTESGMSYTDGTYTASISNVDFSASTHLDLYFSISGKSFFEQLFFCGLTHQCSTPKTQINSIFGLNYRILVECESEEIFQKDYISYALNKEHFIKADIDLASSSCSAIDIKVIETRGSIVEKISAEFFLTEAF